MTIPVSFCRPGQPCEHMCYAGSVRQQLMLNLAKHMLIRRVQGMLR